MEKQALVKSHFDDIHDSDDEDDVLPSQKYEKYNLRDTYRYYLDYKTSLEYTFKNLLKNNPTNPDDTTFQLFLERRSKGVLYIILIIFSYI